jgi:hypothetical protein
MADEERMESEQFYAEANALQSGWGDQLRAIGDLQTRAEHLADITLNEACWLLWTYGSWPSDLCEAFATAMEQSKARRMPWPAWKGLFDDWERKER